LTQCQRNRLISWGCFIIIIIIIIIIINMILYLNTSFIV